MHCTMAANTLPRKRTSLQRTRQRAGCTTGIALLCLCTMSATAQAVQIITGTPSTFTSIVSHQHVVVALHESATQLQERQIRIKPGSTARPMTDADGKHWTCYIPPRLPEPDDNTQVATQEHGHNEGKTPFELLERLSTLCLYRQEGLWTYEMCYKKSARQFRQGSGDNKGEDFSCGTYTGDDKQVEEVKVDTASPADNRLRYVSHNFTGGAPCVLTGAGRTTEVRFTCQKGVNDNVIVSVREFPTCNYIFTISTPLLCKHRQFKPPEEVRRTFVCVPADKNPGNTKQTSKSAVHPHTAHGETESHDSSATGHTSDQTGHTSDQGQTSQAGVDKAAEGAQQAQQEAARVVEGGGVGDGGVGSGSGGDRWVDMVDIGGGDDVSVELPLIETGSGVANLEAALQRGQEYAADMVEAQRQAALSQGLLDPGQPQTTTISITTDCDVLSEAEAEASGTRPRCRISGLTDYQARVVQDQVADGTHLDSQPAQYLAAYYRAYEDAYDQVLTQGRAQGLSDNRARAHARLQATVHAHAIGLAHTGMLPPATDPAPTTPTQQQREEAVQGSTGGSVEGSEAQGSDRAQEQSDDSSAWQSSDDQAADSRAQTQTQQEQATQSQEHGQTQYDAVDDQTEAVNDQTQTQAPIEAAAHQHEEL